jgi:hypothetical protein
MKDPADLVSVGTFGSLAHAQKAKGVLNMAGIESATLLDPNSPIAGESTYTWPGGRPKNAVAQLLVRAEDVDKAAEALLRHYLL